MQKTLQQKLPPFNKNFMGTQKNWLNRPYSYWTGISMQYRFGQGISLKRDWIPFAFDFHAEKTPSPRARQFHFSSDNMNNYGLLVNEILNNFSSTKKRVENTTHSTLCSWQTIKHGQTLSFKSVWYNYMFSIKTKTKGNTEK